MFERLSQFYNSEKWRKFRIELINERTGPDGILYDEYNGKPLLKSYDIVLHHKTPLTLQNVNDYSISLNPENIMIVSHDSHNELHKRFGYMAEKKVYYVYGAPCSGKTTFVNNIKGNNDIIVDIDNIWECLTGRRNEKPNALKTNVFRMLDLLYDMVKTRAGNWEKAFIVTSGAVKSIRLRQIETFGAEGIFIDTDKGTCYEHLQNDKSKTIEQKRQWGQYIEQWFSDYTG